MTILAKHRFQTATKHIARIAMFVALAALLLLTTPGANAQSSGASRPQEVLEAVVEIGTRIPGTARTAGALGTQRKGSGLVISDDGLVLTIGYLILEAIEIDITLTDGRRILASFVAYDHESGFGLVRAPSDLDRHRQMRKTTHSINFSGDYGNVRPFCHKMSPAQHV